MISPKKLIKIARKWQKIAAIGRKRLLFQNRMAAETQIFLKHHPLGQEILLSTLQMVDDLLFPQPISAITCSESYSRCLRKCLSYQVKDLSNCHVMVFSWSTQSHSSRKAQVKIQRKLCLLPWRLLAAQYLPVYLKDIEGNNCLFVATELTLQLCKYQIVLIIVIYISSIFLQFHRCYTMQNALCAIQEIMNKLNYKNQTQYMPAYAFNSLLFLVHIPSYT